MNIQALEIFRAVAETGGVAKAAEQLHRVPSNVTTRIRQLEDDLGTMLFLRDNKRLRLSPAGRTLLDYAQRMLALADEARSALHTDAPQGLLRLGTMESTAATRLPGPIAEYHRRYPEVVLELRTGPTRKLEAMVLSGELEAALVADATADHRIEAVPLFAEELVLIADGGHPPIHSPADAKEETLLLFGSGCAYRQRLESWFTAHERLPCRLAEMASYHAILSCAAAGMGIALIPRSVLVVHPAYGRVSVHEPPDVTGESITALIWRRGFRSARIQALLDILNVIHAHEIAGQAQGVLAHR